jgi:pilus assembly protein Flp/PilA
MIPKKPARTPDQVRGRLRSGVITGFGKDHLQQSLRAGNRDQYLSRELNTESPYLLKLRSNARDKPINNYMSVAGPPCGTKEFAMKNLISSFLKDETAATAIEYGLIAAGISVAIIVIVNGLGSTLNTKFTTINTQLR